MCTAAYKSADVAKVFREDLDVGGELSEHAGEVDGALSAPERLTSQLFPPSPPSTSCCLCLLQVHQSACEPIPDVAVAGDERDK